MQKSRSFILNPLTPIPEKGGLFVSLVGVRGLPERDISSLGVIGWEVGPGWKFFRCRRRRRRRRPGGGISEFTIILEKY